MSSTGAPASGPLVRLRHDAATEPEGGHDLWVFGYGSLMWHPGFAYAQAIRARLTGWHRCFCIWSVVYRGTPLHPGLVLGLDRGGVCEGIAFRVAPEYAREAISYLRWREQVTGVYRETLVPVELAGPARRRVCAVTYLAEPAHPGYAGDLPLRLQAALIRAGRGRSGPNLDYFASTLKHLAELSIREPALERLGVLVSSLLVRKSGCIPTARVARAEVTSPVPLAARRRFKALNPGERRRFAHRRATATWPVAGA